MDGHKKFQCFIARYRELHVANYERPTSPEAKVEVAALIGSILLEWNRAGIRFGPRLGKPE